MRGGIEGLFQNPSRLHPKFDIYPWMAYNLLPLIYSNGKV